MKCIYNALEFQSNIRTIVYISISEARKMQHSMKTTGSFRIIHMLKSVLEPVYISTYTYHIIIYLLYLIVTPSLEIVIFY